MTNNQRASRKSEPFDSLPGPVQEAINAHAKYYAEHHGLGMSLRDDLTYIAQVALRWAPKPTPSDGGLDLAQELRTVLSWEGKRMGAMSAGVLRQVIGRIEKASERSEIAPAMAIAEAQRESDLKLFAQWAKDVELPFGETLESRHTFSIAYEDYVRACPIEHSVLRGERQGE